VETNPVQARMQIVPRPFAWPGKCMVCGAVDRPCLDFGMELEEHGAVYFCVECMAEGARAIGYVSQSKVDELNLKLDFATHNTTAALERVKAFRNELNTSVDSLCSAIDADLDGRCVPGSENESGADDSTSIATAESSEPVGQAGLTFSHEGPTSVSSRASDEQVFNF